VGDLGAAVVGDRKPVGSADVRCQVAAPPLHRCGHRPVSQRDAESAALAAERSQRVWVVFCARILSIALARRSVACALYGARSVVGVRAEHVPFPVKDRPACVGRHGVTVRFERGGQVRMAEPATHLGDRRAGAEQLAGVRVA
jgi:hypothetical protein